LKEIMDYIDGLKLKRLGIEGEIDRHKAEHLDLSEKIDRLISKRGDVNDKLVDAYRRRDIAALWLVEAGGELPGEEVQPNEAPSVSITEYVRTWVENCTPFRLKDMIPAATSGVYSGVAPDAYSAELAKLKKAGVAEFKDGFWRKVETVSDHTEINQTFAVSLAGADIEIVAGEQKNGAGASEAEDEPTNSRLVEALG
jgi:hypothetical protein